MNSTDLYDREELLEELDDDLDLLRKLLDIFERDSAERLGRLRRHVEGGDWASVADETHALKSGVGNFFAGKAYSMASQMEKAARDGAASGPEFQTRVAELEAELAQLREALTDLAKG